jgi:DNA-binding NarL/FixJ family response regulator
MGELDKQFSGNHVLIVEDHPMVADALQSLLQRLNPQLHCTRCDCARSALTQFQQGRLWHRIYVDLDVPGAHGLSLVRQIAQFGFAAKTVILTGFENAPWQAEAKAMGLLGYISKGMPLEDYVQAISASLLGLPSFGANTQITVQATRLTRRQQDVLCLLHRGYSSKQIASQLGLNTGTVDNHVTGLLRALNASSRTHAIAKAIGLGYLRMQDLPQM